MHKRVRFLSPPSKTHITSTEDAFFIRWGSHDSEMSGDLHGVNQNKGNNWTYSSELQRTYLTIIISHCHFIIIVCVCMISHFSCCLTICSPMNCSPPGSSVQRTVQAKILEWVAISISRGSSQPRDRTCTTLQLLLWKVGSLHQCQLV